MENQATKLKSAIETATSEKLEAADEQLLVKACDAIKTRGDLKKYAAVQAPIEGTKSIKPQEPASKTSKLTKELELIRDNIILTNSIIDEHDPSENVRHNGALTDLHYQLKEGEKKLQAIITDYTFQDENILNFCLELNDDVNKTFDRYNLLIKGRKPNPYNPSVSLKKEEPKTISEAPKIQPPNAFQKIDQPPKTQQQQQQEQIIKPQAKVFNLLDDEDDLFAQAPSTQQNNQKQDQNQEQFQFQQAPIQQQAPLVYPQQHSIVKIISNAMSSLYINQPNQQIPSIAQPNFNQIPAQQMPQYIQQPQYPGMPMNNMGMMNVIPPVMQMQPMQPGIQQQQMTGVPIQYSMNQQSQGQVKQYGLDEIKNQQKKPFDQIDDLFGLDSKPARNTK